jgi:hypothetical protein
VKITYYKLVITFNTPVLGSQPPKDVASEFIAKRAGLEQLPDDEAEMLPEALDRGTTVFHKDKDTGLPCFIDYQVKGFLKAAGSVFNGANNSEGVRNLKSKVNNLVFVSPRALPLHQPNGDKITFNERPLRAETAQGPRIALARSEQLPEGTWFQFGLKVYGSEITEKLIREIMDYGENMGLGQWRNGSYGQFHYTLVKEGEGTSDPYETH